MDRFQKLSFVALLVLLIFIFQSCKFDDSSDAKCNNTSFSPRGEYNYNLDIVVSLHSLDTLISAEDIAGKYFCLTDTTVVLQSYYTDQPCFQLKPGQSYTGEFGYQPIRTYYEVIDPYQFSIYFRSIPRELNKFLEIRIKNYASLIESIEGERRGLLPLSPSNLWPSYYTSRKTADIAADSTEFSLFGVLHSLVRTTKDSIIYIYLPLNIGIKTPQYKGVLPPRSGYKTEINNYGNPAYKLTPDFRQELDLSSSKVLGECASYSKVNFNAIVKPEILMPSLVDYKKMVQKYLNDPLKNPADATFSDPYVNP